MHNQPITVIPRRSAPQGSFIYSQLASIETMDAPADAWIVCTPCAVPNNPEDNGASGFHDVLCGHFIHRDEDDAMATARSLANSHRVTVLRPDNVTPDTRRFTVCYNLPGCLPEMEPYTVVGAGNAWSAWLTEGGIGYSRAEFTSALDANGADGLMRDEDGEVGNYVLTVTRQEPVFVPGMASHAIGFVPKHAWPGGYPIAYLTFDGSYLCADCVNREPEVHVGEQGNADWQVVGHQVLEGDAAVDYDMPGGVRCDHCHAVILEADS